MLQWLLCRRIGHKWIAGRASYPKIVPLKCRVCRQEYYHTFIHPGWGKTPDEIMDKAERMGLL